MKLLKDLLLTELNAAQQAKIELGVSDASDDVSNARMNDAQKARAKEQQIKDEQSSDDPIDRKISTLRKQIAQLMQQKALKKAGI